MDGWRGGEVKCVVWSLNPSAGCEIWAAPEYYDQLNVEDVNAQEEVIVTVSTRNTHIVFLWGLLIN